MLTVEIIDLSNGNRKPCFRAPVIKWERLMRHPILLLFFNA